ncbi:hypothetical protein CY34DRAFT_18774 [Suillus luteus UH-Slu-Lm8-n1]|uniref:proton-translocating NAD(P)(+) transhydrogenase n=1 Tax=Suillus luteus UH-Slu-Lm8-n1 TaxID=930992 RepID=A0A0C9ZU20_9AGAM|nr:hypothetical protein CY34DRAFT_18774 [Suillus luteus UH-Slu-Lm8-n1]
MSVMNAISGMVGVGGLFVMGGGYLPETFPRVLGALSVLLASVNVASGFVITKRMLDMFKRPMDPPESSWLYGIPAVIFTNGFSAAVSTSMAGLVWAGCLTSSMLCIVGFPPALLTQFAGLAIVRGTIGAIIDRHITAIELPQMVAALHLVVGLAAVFTSISSVLADPSHLTTLHLVTAYLRVIIGGITFTGSIVAFLKLAGKMGSRPLMLPGKYVINSSLLRANVLTMAAIIISPIWRENKIERANDQYIVNLDMNINLELGVINSLPRPGALEKLILSALFMIIEPSGSQYKPSLNITLFIHLHAQNNIGLA